MTAGFSLNDAIKTGSHRPPPQWERIHQLCPDYKKMSELQTAVIDRRYSYVVLYNQQQSDSPATEVNQDANARY